MTISCGNGENMEDMLCDGLKLPKKIYMDGDKKCKVVK